MSDDGQADVLELDRSRFLAALLAGDSRAATDVALGAVARGVPVQDVYVEVLQEALYEVGRLWEANLITVAAEHLATAVAQAVVASLYDYLPRPEVPRGALVLTGVEGELHQVGGHIVADTLEADGWDVRFLGADVPLAAVLRAVAEHRPRVLGISCTMLDNLPRVARLVAAVREAFGADAPGILLGGSAFRTAPEKAWELGADAWAPDLRAAVAAARGAAGG